MIFWRLVELGALAIGGVLFLTQVLIPLWAGRPLFPLVRGPRRAAETRLGVARERATVRDLEREARATTTDPPAPRPRRRWRDLSRRRKEKPTHD